MRDNKKILSAYSDAINGFPPTAMKNIVTQDRETDDLLEQLSRAANSLTKCRKRESSRKAYLKSQNARPILFERGDRIPIFTSQGYPPRATASDKAIGYNDFRQTSVNADHDKYLRFYAYEVRKKSRLIPDKRSDSVVFKNGKFVSFEF